MPAFRTGKVVELLDRQPDLIELRVALEGDEIDAVAFPAMLGPVEAGDRVVVNTTGIELGLGTGGVGFVLWNLDGSGPEHVGRGHIVKLRYTPWQTEVLAAEAPESEHHERLIAAESIGGMPVVVGTLHSQLAAAAAGLKAAAPDARVGYLMTDGAALPIAWSRLVRSARQAGLIDVTCTAGHAFGGDLEAVNVFSGLAALRHAAKVDAVVVAMGPGVVGTGTRLGFTGIEQGQALDAATALAGTAIACLRITFADERPRHSGVSHHSLTALRIAARERCIVAVPALPDQEQQTVHEQLRAAGIVERHRVVTVDASGGLELMRTLGIRPSSMGRAFDEVPELFAAAAAAGRVAGETL